MIRDVMLVLIKDFSTIQTISSLAKELKLSRVGVWKIIKKLESEKYIKIESVGSGKTNASIIRINWDNILVEKSLALYLTEESIKQKRWRFDLSELENTVDFLILFGSVLHSPKKANDIDIITVANKNKFVNIQKIIDKIQKTQIKKIHSINFTASEFKTELKKPNKAFLDSVKKGVVLFGQEKFVKLIKEVEYGR